MNIYRIDRFRVPAAAREPFLDRVQKTHTFLRAQHGFVKDFLVEEPGEGHSTVVTIAIWDNQESVGAVKAAMSDHYKQINFDPKAFVERLGIEAEYGQYADIA